ncbi:hypothetical protein ALC57_15094 [Trachymyrmex cornetzi]|uniref:Uncharacterized protein n=1 Tax=Trachymyrmex cornetzi TaxID=471704 RepID=A0A151IXG2_9HYME|nr:hypothetical protein ALC57_15094 [Trachymyrmex cornetzi]
MYLALCHPSDILDLSAEQLQYIPRVILLRVYGDYIDNVLNKLPKHVKVDSEVRTYRRCDEHYNQPWQRTHIDGPAPKIKDCNECQRRAAIPSIFIFPRKPFQDHFIRDGPIGCIGTGNDSGWMTEKDFYKFMQHFKNHVRPFTENVLFLE